MHPLEVAHILADMQMDLVCMRDRPAARHARGHSAKPEELREAFGEDVARCVDGVTKLSKISLANREDRQAESLRKMLLAMTADIRVIIVKLADRLAQHADDRVSAAGTAGGDRAGNDRHLRAHRAPAGDGQSSRRTGRSGFPDAASGSGRTNCGARSSPSSTEHERWLEHVQKQD